MTKHSPAAPPEPSRPAQSHTKLQPTAKHHIKSFMLSFLTGGSGAATPDPSHALFAKTDPKVDGEECLRDCESCTVKYPRSFKIDEGDALYGHVKEWATHLLVATAKGDWVRDVEDEKGSVMQAVGKATKPSNGRMMLSASNMPTPDDTPDYDQPTSALLLPAFTLIQNLQPSNVPLLISSVVNASPTTSAPLKPFHLPATITDPANGMPSLTTRACPHSAVILMCSQRTRDARCGQSAPLLRKELERILRPLGLYRDLHDERPGGVGIYFVSHVGGHKYSANVMVYRRPNAFGQDDKVVTNGDAGAKAPNGNGEHANGEHVNGEHANGEHTNGDSGGSKGEVGAGQCIWLARVMPEDCENLVRYTVLKGKVVKPETQLRGGFDRGRGLMSW